MKRTYYVDMIYFDESFQNFSIIRDTYIGLDELNKHLVELNRRDLVGFCLQHYKENFYQIGALDKENRIGVGVSSRAISLKELYKKHPDSATKIKQFFSQS